ncbi:F-box/kelch-repeat protein At3g06240-like [Neltuma alba]|uniref:F-box/kelch-repeat protein At3g06240-like n=1 Tax=Neltuma alba TaxID=207710 RepID=UPI0010A59FBC|nr:F-box/kelch-repeat protein At3g06240-like [Prosopis alba]
MQVREVQNPPLIGSLRCVKVIGSSNGLLCVEIEQSPPLLLLWNPATREIRPVPRTITTNYFDYDSTVGFGHNPIVNDYKIVKTFAEIDYEISLVEVYSLSTGSWKEIELGNLEGVQLFGDAFAANGAIFWYGLRLGVEEDGEDDIEVLVSFDIAMEVFTVIPGPSPSYNLTMYEGKLAALSSYGIGDCPYYQYYLFDLWVMEEDIGSSGERWSWSKKYTSIPCLHHLHPGTIWRNEVVMSGIVGESEHGVENNGLKLGLYLFNATTNEFKMFAIPRHNPMCDVFNYVESLVVIGNIDIEEPSS